MCFPLCPMALPTSSSLTLLTTCLAILAATSSQRVLPNNTKSICAAGFISFVTNWLPTALSTCAVTGAALLPCNGLSRNVDGGHLVCCQESQ